MEAGFFSLAQPWLLRLRGSELGMGELSVTLPLKCFLRFIYLKGKVTEKGLPSTGPLPKWPQQPGLCQAKAKSQELHPALPRGWQGPKYSDHCLQPSPLHEQEAGPEAEWLELKLAFQYGILMWQTAP